jgi:hypothetical protein
MESARQAPELPSNNTATNQRAGESARHTRASGASACADLFSVVPEKSGVIKESAPEYNPSTLPVSAK